MSRTQFVETRLDLVDTFRGQVDHGLWSGGFDQPPNGHYGQFVVGLMELGPASVREEEHLGWTTPATRTVDPLLARSQDSFFQKNGQMATDSCWSQGQSFGEFSRR